MKAKTLKPKVKSKSHLTRDDRIRIEEKLNSKISIRMIAKELERSPSTILREIKNHTETKRAKQNDCAFRTTCSKKHICDNRSCTKWCRTCRACQKYCKDYESYVCDTLKNAPYICNGCSKISMCNLSKAIYKGKEADKEYHDTLSNLRNGFILTCEEIIDINDKIAPLIKLGQSPYHIVQALGTDLKISESTLRRLIANEELDVRNIDLRNVVKRKERRSPYRKMHDEMIMKIKEGRRYEDYLKYIAENEVAVSQMDCVEGTQDDNATLLTLHLPSFHLQLAFIMNYHTSACVVHTLDMIEDVLGRELFHEVFPLILTDNGHEFTDVSAMERSIFGGTRTKIFFCEPNRSDEKGSCENNHKFIRYVIPKGTSLEQYSQTDISLMMNHINSCHRKSLFGQCPYSFAKALLPEDFFILLGLERIPANEVHLKPDLLKKSIPSK